MTNVSQAALTVLVDALYVDRAADEPTGAPAATLDQYAGTGTPASEAYAEALGIDYICALEDGTIAAWGGDIARNGYTDRELVFISPEMQLAAPAEDAED